MIKLFPKTFLFRRLIALLLFLVGCAWIPAAWNARWADRWFNGDVELQNALAGGMEEWMDQELGRDDFTTGSKQFDGEWLYGTYAMAAMGFGQCALNHPADRAHYLQRMEQAIDEMLSMRVRKFDIELWHSDPLETLDSNEGHAAYLGYMNLAMSFHHLLDPDSRFAELNDRISDSLRRRIQASPTLLLESYPWETYPVDNCAVITSVALNSRANGNPHDPLAEQWADQCRRKYTDPKSGLLIQSVNGRTGNPRSYPRGSGTTLGLYFLSFMDSDLSKDLYKAVESGLSCTICGFGFMREYPRGIHGRGDIDSGMVILGIGLSPTGFALGGARIHGDGATFRKLYATAHAAGAPLRSGDTLHFVTGASLGDAILFAMLTAPHGGIEGVSL